MKKNLYLFCNKNGILYLSNSVPVRYARLVKVNNKHMIGDKQYFVQPNDDEYVFVDAPYGTSILYDYLRHVELQTIVVSRDMCDHWFVPDKVQISPEVALRLVREVPIWEDDYVELNENTLKPLH